MSEQNVRVVRGIYSALNRGDFDAALEAGHADVEHDWSRSVGPYQGIYRGREEIRRFWISFRDAVDELTFEVEDTIDAGEHVVALVRVHVRGRGSGVQVAARGPHVWTFRDGKVIRFRLFQEKAEALEAVGLQE
jgi:ketosteroid isomerase-like protein